MIQTFKVTAVSSYAFTGNDNLRSIRIGKNVKRISPYAFYGCGKLKTLNVNSKLLTAKKIKGCLKGSAVNKVSVVKRAVPKLKLYKKIFAKKNTGAPKKGAVKKGK